MKRPEQQLRTIILTAFLLLSGALAAFAAAPVARDDSVVATDRYLTTEGGIEIYSILIDVLANDEDVDGDPLEVVIQGDLGFQPEIWSPSPVGTVSYLGAGLFDLRFGKEELGDAREVTFQYELEGALSVATVRVTVAGEGPAPTVEARDDIFVKTGNCWVDLPVLANDTSLDTIQRFFDVSDGMVVARHPADPQILVLRGGGGGRFTYEAMDSKSGATDQATVTVFDTGNPRGSLSTKMTDCFDRQDEVLLHGETVGFYYDSEIGWPSWTATELGHLDHSATQADSSQLNRRAYLPFDPDGPQWVGQGSAYELRGTFRASSTKAEWVALAFTHGSGVVFSEAALWARINVDDGAAFVNGRWGADLEEKLGSTTPTGAGYTFVQEGVNHFRLRLDTAPVVPQVDLWVNGTRALSVPFVDEAGSPVSATELLSSIENVGFFINYGQHASSPGDVWFDDFELGVSDVQLPRVQPKEDSPGAGASVENGATLDMGPLHLGCTSAHTGCYSSREKSLWLTNDGNVDLEVDHLNFTGPTQWTLVEPASSSFVVAPGGAQEIRVLVDSWELGPTESRLELSTNDPDLPKLQVSFAAEVTQAPVADFVSYCDGLTCFFDGGPSTGSGLSDFSFYWFLDGDPLGSGESHEQTFTQSGVHTVALRVEDATGAAHRRERTIAVRPEAAFTITCSNDTRDCYFDGAFTTAGVSGFRYDFGDGEIHEAEGTPTALMLPHTYATSGRYTVSLCVWDEAGQVDCVAHQVVLSPVADFTVSCQEGALTCTFDGSSSTPELAAYTWSFGDGSSVADGVTQEHPYPTSGIFTVTLTVVDRSGQLAAHQALATVKPWAELTFECDGLRCELDGGGSSPGVSTYSWDFGHDGATGVGVAPVHDFPEAGDYGVTLTVTDISGQTASATETVTLSDEELLFLLLFDRR